LVGSDLVRAAQAGDPAALTALLAEYLPVTYNIVGRALNGHADVDDVVQETLIRVVRRLPSLQDPEKFRPWLASIAIRQVQERGRNQAATVRSVPLDEAPDEPDPAPDFVDLAITRLNLTGERRDLLEAVRWLNDPEHQLLALWWQELDGGLSRAELAEALGLSPQHAAVRIQRLRGQLTLAWTLTRAWRADPRCPELIAAAQTWDGRPDPRWLKRLGRHVRDCSYCSGFGRRHGLEHGLLGIGLVPLPALFGSDPLSLLTSAAQAGIDPVLHLPGLIRRALNLFTGKATAVTGVLLVSTAALSYPVYHYALAPPPAAIAPRPVPSASAPAVIPATSVPITSATPTPSRAAPIRTGPGVTEADIFVAPNGNDEADGSLRRPYASLGRAASVVRPGQVIAVRGGRYQLREQVRIETNGTAGQRITVSNYAGEQPVLDAAGITGDQEAISHRGAYWTVEWLEIRNSPGSGYICRACRHDVFRRLSLHDNQGTGMQFRDTGTDDNQVLDSDFFNNHDDDAGTANADGLAINADSGPGNVIRGVRAWNNADDGVDVSGSSAPVTIEHNWAYGNGVNRWGIPVLKSDGNGFAFGGAPAGGGVDHTISTSAAWSNTGYGFTEAGNTGAPRLTRNTAYRNEKDGFALFYSAAVMKNNLALGNSREAVLSDAATSVDNSWDQSGWSLAALRDTDPASAVGDRAGDGSLPDTAFLTQRRNPLLGAPMS
jgi:RNA polymerase sigma factor (sigma-70 family)